MALKHRPILELLEGRMLLSKVHAPIVPVAETLDFLAPGNSSGGVRALVSQQASSVTLTLQRSEPGLSKIRDSIQVEVATGLISAPSNSVASAVAGVQYQPVFETVTFPPGVTSVPVTIPILAGAANPGMLSFAVAAIQVGVNYDPNAPGQATEDVYLAENINAPVPRITGAHLVVTGKRTSDVDLQFSMPMDPNSVQNPAAYGLTDTTIHSSGGFLSFLIPNILNFGFPTYIGIETATYNPTTNTVDLHIAKSVDARDVYQIAATETPPLLDAAGTPINEDGTGGGGNFAITLSNKKATISTF
jgi:hypothetical protein